MDFSLKYDLRDCINELYRIADDLRAVVSEIQQSIHGIDTKDTVKALNHAADKYEKAANKLQKLL